MHEFLATTVALTPLAIADWFALTTGDLERVATALLGELPGRRWVRHGDKFAVIASLKLGSVAPKLAAELSALTAETRKILTAEPRGSGGAEGRRSRGRSRGGQVANLSLDVTARAPFSGSAT